MHELSMAESLIGILVDEARNHGIVSIKKVKLQVGELAAVVPDSLTFCFELVSRDTIAEGAVLEIENVPIVAHCDRCDLTFKIQDSVFQCPRCEEPVFELLSGRELSVTSIEGETGE
jgi:hydrogenase nickel incorporation protein HypA/HybF